MLRKASWPEAMVASSCLTEADAGSDAAAMLRRGGAKDRDRWSNQWDPDALLQRSYADYFIVCCLDR